MFLYICGILITVMNGPLQSTHVGMCHVDVFNTLCFEQNVREVVI